MKKLDKIAGRIGGEEDSKCEKFKDSVMRYLSEDKKFLAFACRTDWGGNHVLFWVYQKGRVFVIEGQIVNKFGKPIREIEPQGFSDPQRMLEKYPSGFCTSDIRKSLEDELLKGLSGEIDWRPTETIPEDWY